jgi:hypothetical protein
MKFKYLNSVQTKLVARSNWFKLMIRGDVDVFELSSSLTEDMKRWSHYLLSKGELSINMPIEPKLKIFSGLNIVQIFE